MLSDEIQQLLAEKYECQYHALCPSTQIICRESKATHMLCVADSQNSGEGQHGRHWHSPAGVNLYFSLKTTLPRPPVHLSLLPIILPLHITDTLVTNGLSEQASTHEDERSSIMLKWPNDLLFEGRKLAGCLTESTVQSDGSLSLIFGMGININMDATEAHNAIDQPWTSLKQITGNTQSRESVLTLIIKRLLDTLDHLSSHSFEQHATLWQRYNALQGNVLEISGHRDYLAHYHHLDEFGRLWVTPLGGDKPVALTSERLTLKTH